MNKPKIIQSQIKDVEFGTNVTVVEPVNLYGCKIGSDCFVGPFVEIQKDVIIGDQCKIQSHAFICEQVKIGNDCFISHGVMFINDTFRNNGPARGNRQFWKSTTIGNHVSFGTNATIMPVEIVDYVVVGAGAVVTQDITIPGVYVGNPARLLKYIELDGK